MGQVRRTKVTDVKVCNHWYTQGHWTETLANSEKQNKVRDAVNQIGEYLLHRAVTWGSDKGKDQGKKFPQSSWKAETRLSWQRLSSAGDGEKAAAGERPPLPSRSCGWATGNNRVQFEALLPTWQEGKQWTKQESVAQLRTNAAERGIWYKSFCRAWPVEIRRVLKSFLITAVNWEISGSRLTETAGRFELGAAEVHTGCVTTLIARDREWNPAHSKSAANPLLGPLSRAFIHRLIPALVTIVI